MTFLWEKSWVVQCEQKQILNLVQITIDVRCAMWYSSGVNSKSCELAIISVRVVFPAPTREPLTRTYGKRKSRGRSGRISAFSFDLRRLQITFLPAYPLRVFYFNVGMGVEMKRPLQFLILPEIAADFSCYVMLLENMSAYFRPIILPQQYPPANALAQEFSQRVMT